jgi:hypothetical protein
MPRRVHSGEERDRGRPVGVLGDDGCAKGRRERRELMTVIEFLDHHFVNIAIVIVLVVYSIGAARR